MNSRNDHAVAAQQAAIATYLALIRTLVAIPFNLARKTFEVIFAAYGDGAPLLAFDVARSPTDRDKRSGSE